MYTTPDEDRSDLYLAGAVFFIGPLILEIILRGVSLPPTLRVVLSLLVIIATTVLVPILLLRYRKERLSHFGFGGTRSTFVNGFVAALPIAAVIVVANLVRVNPPLTGMPVADVVTTGATSAIDTVIEAIAGLCVVLLAIYATVKARSAFRSDPRYMRTTMVELGRIVAIIAAAAAVLLFVTLLLRGGDVAQALQYFLLPLGVAAGVWLVYRTVPGSLLTSRATLLTPMVILGVAALLPLLTGAFELVVGLWTAAMLAALGLAAGVLLERHRSAWAPLGLGVGLVLFTRLVG